MDIQKKEKKMNGRNRKEWKMFTSLLETRGEEGVARESRSSGGGGRRDNRMHCLRSTEKRKEGKEWSALPRKYRKKQRKKTGMNCFGNTGKKKEETQGDEFLIK